MSDAPTSALLDWFADHHSDSAYRAGPLVFVDIEAAGTLIDKAEAAGVSIRHARAFAVADGLASPVNGQALDPSADALLDCETPSGATCGVVRRTIRGRWATNPPPKGRHMVLLDLDDARPTADHTTGGN